jgi:hypothetical protein
LKKKVISFPIQLCPLPFFFFCVAHPRANRTTASSITGQGCRRGS